MNNLKVYFCWKLWCIFLNCIFCLEISIPSVFWKSPVCFIWSSYSFTGFSTIHFSPSSLLYLLYNSPFMCIHMHLGFLFLNFSLCPKISEGMSWFSQSQILFILMHIVRHHLFKCHLLSKRLWFPLSLELTGL